MCTVKHSDGVPRTHRIAVKHHCYRRQITTARGAVCIIGCVLLLTAAGATSGVVKMGSIPKCPDLGARSDYYRIHYVCRTFRVTLNCWQITALA